MRTEHWRWRDIPIISISHCVLHLRKLLPARHHNLGSTGKEEHPSGIKAAIIREKGVNRDRDIAYALYLAGFDVKDVHMTDLISGRETLEDINLIAFVGGFSNSDVLGSAKGWAGAFLYNEKAKQTLDAFFAGKTPSVSVSVTVASFLLNWD